MYVYRKQGLITTWHCSHQTQSHRILVSIVLVRSRFANSKYGRWVLYPRVSQCKAWWQVLKRPHTLEVGINHSTMILWCYYEYYILPEKRSGLRFVNTRWLTDSRLSCCCVVFRMYVHCERTFYIESQASMSFFVFVSFSAHNKAQHVCKKQKERQSF